MLNVENEKFQSYAKKQEKVPASPTVQKVCILTFCGIWKPLRVW